MLNIGLEYFRDAIVGMLQRMKNVGLKRRVARIRL